MSKPEFIKLAQTLAMGWVITLDNPFEEGWETEIASFSHNNLTSKKAAAMATVSFAQDTGIEVIVQSHKSGEAELMRVLLKQAAALLGHKFDGEGGA